MCLSKLASFKQSWCSRGLLMARDLRVSSSRHNRMHGGCAISIGRFPCFVDLHAHSIPLSSSLSTPQSAHTYILTDNQYGSRSEEAGRRARCRKFDIISLIANNKTNDRFRHGRPLPSVYSWHSVEYYLDMIQELSPVFWRCPW